jgi:predicted dehydrogenase
MSEWGIAVVGSGFIGPVHVEALRRNGLDVVGVLGSSAEQSRRAAESLGVDAAYSDYGELLEDRRVRAVHITAPNRWHFEFASRALLAGKHVMCEKPLAMNSSESSELVRLARESGRAAAVTYNVRYYPLCREAAERTRQGELGTVLHIAGSYVQDWLLLDTDYNWRVSAQDGGALRSVADIGTHWLDLVQYILGQQVMSVCADLQTVHRMRLKAAGGAETFKTGAKAANQLMPVSVETDDAGFILLRFNQGARGVLWVSQVTAGRKNCLRFEIAGSRQALAWDSERANELWIGHRETANESLLRDPALMRGSARELASYPGGHLEGFADTFKQLFREFYSYIAAGDLSLPAPFPTFADGHHEILLCEAVLRSHQEQRWVTVRDPASPPG